MRGEALLSSRLTVERLMTAIPFRAARRVQTETSAHALLPLAALLVHFFYLRQCICQTLAAKLTHLQVKQSRNDRHQGNDEDVNQCRELLIDTLADFDSPAPGR